MHEVLFFAIVAVAIGLLVTERLRPDLVALLIIVTLSVTRLLSAQQALAGFSSEPAIVIASMFVLSAGFAATGLSELIGQGVGRLAGRRPARMLAVIMPASALLSALTHHVTITALMLPVMLSLARQRRVPVSKLLMPMAIGSSLGTTISIIGAPAFLVGSELLHQAGQPRLEVFSIAPIGLSLTVAGTLYMVLLGRFLLPTRRPAEDPRERFRLTDYMTEVSVLPGSPFVGKTPAQVTADKNYDLQVLGWLEQGRQLRRASSRRPLQEGDVLLVRSTPDALLTIRQQRGVELQPVTQYGAGSSGEEGRNGTEEVAEQLAQAVVAPSSELIGRTLGEVDFHRRYGAVVIGLWRAGGAGVQELSRARLRAGDVLVLQGSSDVLGRVARDRQFLLLVPFHGEVRQRRKAYLAAAIMLATVLAAAFDFLSLGMATLTGALAMVLSGCLTPRQAYRAIDLRIFVFVAGAIPLGVAMKSSGSATLLAGWLQQAVGGWPEQAMLLVLFATVALIVQFMGSDAGTTALLGPVAIALAGAVGHAPQAYVVTVAMAAVTSILTPMAHHNLIIYSPGGYRFFDYLRVGGPLTAIIGLIVAGLAPRLWPG